MERNMASGVVTLIEPQIQVKQSTTILVVEERPSPELLNLYLKNLTHHKRKHHRCLAPELHKLIGN